MISLIVYNHTKDRQEALEVGEGLIIEDGLLKIDDDYIRKLVFERTPIEIENFDPEEKDVQDSPNK